MGYLYHLYPYTLHVQFTGYDVGMGLIQVSGCISNMFPSDGGQIQTEKTHFVKGWCSLLTHCSFIYSLTVCSCFLRIRGEGLVRFNL